MANIWKYEWLSKIFWGLKSAFGTFFLYLLLKICFVINKIYNILNFLYFYYFSMIIWILYILIIILFFIAIRYILPIFITLKIYNLELSRSRYFRLFIIILFFPISILFSRGTYNHLKDKQKISWILGFLKIILVIIIFEILSSVLINEMLIKKYIVTFFQVNWKSMYSTIYDKEILLTFNLSRNFNRWDIVVLKKWEKKYINRIIWLQNEKVKIVNWQVFVFKIDKFEKLEENYLDIYNKDKTYVSWNIEEVIYDVPNDSYFLMWDNRNYSLDSRECYSDCSFEWQSEFISKNSIVWKVNYDFWYFDIWNFSFRNEKLWIDTYPKFFDIN